MIYFEDCVVGKVWEGGKFALVEKEIVDYAKQWDPQPIHIDVEGCKKGVHGKVTAPACYLFAIASKLCSRIGEFAIIGGVSYEFDIPNAGKAGDELSLSFTCIESRVSKSKADRGIVKLRLRLDNQLNEPVYILTSTVLIHRRPS